MRHCSTTTKSVYISGCENVLYRCTHWSMRRPHMMASIWYSTRKIPSLLFHLSAGPVHFRNLSHSMIPLYRCGRYYDSLGLEMNRLKSMYFMKDPCDFIRKGGPGPCLVIFFMECSPDFFFYFLFVYLEFRASQFLTSELQSMLG